MKCQAVLLVLAISLILPVSADPAREVAEIRRLLESRGERIDARALHVLRHGNARDLAQLRRALQHAPPPREANIGQGRTARPARKVTRKLQSARGLRISSLRK